MASIKPAGVSLAGGLKVCLLVVCSPSVVDPKLFFLDPTFPEILDPDPISDPT